MSIENKMTDELWKKLEKFLSYNVIIPHNEYSPNWINILCTHKYLNYAEWGAGSQGTIYYITDKGREALYESGFTSTKVSSRPKAYGTISIFEDEDSHNNFIKDCYTYLSSLRRKFF